MSFPGGRVVGKGVVRAVVRLGQRCVAVVPMRVFGSEVLQADVT